MCKKTAICCEPYVLIYLSNIKKKFWPKGFLEKMERIH